MCFAIPQSGRLLFEGLRSLRNAGFLFGVERADFGFGSATLLVLRIHFPRIQPHQEAKDHHV